MRSIPQSCVRLLLTSFHYPVILCEVDVRPVRVGSWLPIPFPSVLAITTKTLVLPFCVVRRSSLNVYIVLYVSLTCFDTDKSFLDLNLHNTCTKKKKQKRISRPWVMNERYVATYENSNEANLRFQLTENERITPVPHQKVCEIIWPHP